MSSSSSNVYASVMSLNEYLASIKIPLEEIESATNNFNDENLVTQTSSSKIYKGRRIQSSGEFYNIVVRICMQLHIAVNEVITLKDLRHKNIAPILKISQPVNDTVVIIINKHEANESLDKHLISSSTLSWMQRLHICVGIADALSYLHYDAIGDQSTVIHGNIKSSKILLDQDWEPKLHGFGFAVRAKRNQLYLTNQYNGSLQYMDPAYETTRGFFSFGVVLFEVLFGRDASCVISTPDHNDSLGFARVAQVRYEEKTLDDMIYSDLREQMNLESLNIFSEIAYFCLKEQRSQRPDMKQVLQRLKGALEVQRKHESLEHSAPGEGTSSNHFEEFVKEKHFYIISSSSSNVDNSVLSPEEYADSISIPFEDIESATNNFAEENLIQTSSSKIYKGRLMQTLGESVNIVVRIHFLNYTEIDMLKDLRHKNIVPIYKTTHSDHGKVIVNKHEANGILDKHLDSSTLSWMQRLHICVGIVRALTYLHYDAVQNHSVIHSNIKSSKILLDHNWEPKLHDFGIAVKVKRYQLHRINIYLGSFLYMDPEYEYTSGLTHKSDVFSFGVVLFEVLFGKEASVATQHHKKYWKLTEMARASYEDKTLDEKIDPNLHKQMNLESLNIFSETAYFCLKKQRSERLNMKKVLQRLERALERQCKHDQSLVLSNRLKVNFLDHLRFRLSDIRLATDYFSSIYCIGSGGYGMVYKAKLGHFGGISSSTATKGENKAEFSDKHSTVAIKRLFRRVDGQAEQGFLGEVELLRKCKHPNIVSLIGFCNEEQEMILIYEYASNGSLEDYLGNCDKINNLSWAQRIKICIDIAYGLEYLHKVTKDKECIIHRDIKSANILLDDKWEAKIADFGLSKLHPTYDQCSTFISGNIGGTEVYMDPEYLQTGKLKTQSDIYSFGVVLCEMISGNLAYEKMYNTTGLPSLACQCVNDRTIEKLVDPQLKEANENIYGLSDELYQDSLYTFLKIASECVAKTQIERPTMKVIIKELEKSLNLQNDRKDNLHISLEDLKLGTQNFKECNYTRRGRFWKMYKGQIKSFVNANGCTLILAKRFDSRSEEGNSQFMRELKVLFEHKHKNIVGLVGYCNEMGENIIAYEYASNGTLDEHLDNVDLTWIKRLKLGLDVATGLEHLHTGGSTKDTPVIHRDIKGSNILLDDDWRAKISNLEGSLSYLDPQYETLGLLNAASDIYSLGVVLLEMMLGRLVCAEEMEAFKELFLVERSSLDEKIFVGVKEQIVPGSLDAYSAITFKCLDYDGRGRPGASELVRELRLALAYQVSL